MAGRRVLVTGAAGFLGAAATRRLVAQGHEVLAWIRPTSDPRRLAGVKGLRFLRLDVRDASSPAGRAVADEALATFRPEAVVDAAWQGTRGAARDDPDQIANVALGVQVLRLAAGAGARRFVGIGSQAEYGPHDSVITEDTPTRPTTLYGAAKLAGGHLCLALAQRLGVSAAWARVFSVYGPGQRSGALIPDLATALRDDRDFPLGSGAARWDFLFEDDAADALARLAARDDAVGVFNVASGSAVPLRDVMIRVGRLAAAGKEVVIGTRPSSPDDLPRLEADVTRLRRAVGWAPQTELDEGLVRTVAAVLDEPRRVTDGNR